MIKLLDRFIAWLMGDKPAEPPPPPADRWGSYTGDDDEPEDADVEPAPKKPDAFAVLNEGFADFEKLTRDAGERRPEFAPIGFGGEPTEVPLSDGVARKMVRMAWVPENGNPTFKIEAGTVFCQLTNEHGVPVQRKSLFVAAATAPVSFGGSLELPIEPIDGAPEWTGTACVVGHPYIRVGPGLDEPRSESPVAKIAHKAVMSGRLPAYIAKVLFAVSCDPSIATTEGGDDSWGVGGRVVLVIRHRDFTGRIALTLRGERLVRAEVYGHHADVATAVLDDFQLVLRLGVGFDPEGADLVPSLPPDKGILQMRIEDGKPVFSVNGKDVP